MNQLDLQAFLFEEATKRIDLVNFVTKLDTNYRVSVYRNHSFELIENTIKPYLEYGRIGVEFSYSSYDDSLSFIELDTTVDAVILWLDLSAYELANVSDFIEERIEYLRSLFSGNVLFAAFGGELTFEPQNLDVVSYDLRALEQRLGERFLDLRLEAFSGTKLSSATSLEISKDLGLNYLPTLLEPNLKGIVVDLDNTLYQGVLGEDGFDGVVLTQAHEQLQAKLKGLSEQGFFLCIASKNDERDVVDLFGKRTDFPLHVDDFIQVHASWESKADSISVIAQTLNISVNSLVFLDDNLGELVSVQEAHPAIRLIWAKDDASQTHEVLSNFPGLLKLDSKKEDGLRKQDTEANTQRLALQNSVSLERYIKDLNMHLTFEVDNPAHSARVAELSNKTNQFIFSYQRYSTQQVKELMHSDQSAVVTISLSDKLSESGVVGVVVLTKQVAFDQSNAWGLLNECFVSCRALGRGIDKEIVLGSIGVAINALELDERLQVNFTQGERNTPAQKFCNEYFATLINSPGQFQYEIPSDYLQVTIEKY